jgi:hypothetical protein
MKKSNDVLKQALLLGFVAIGVVMIAMIWVENLSGQGQANPAFHRDAAPATIIYTQPDTTQGPALESGAPDATSITTQMVPGSIQATPSTPVPTLPDNLRDE